VNRDATTVYTDGACLGNPGPGGWAWAVPNGRYASGPAAHTTNQRMEIQAALEAVTSLQGPLDVFSDSTYVVNCFRDRWWEGWLARGWVNKAKKPVANRDLWEPLINAYRADPSRIRFSWVKGHGTDQMNDLVDRLAVEAATTQQGRSGTGTPETLGPGDRPGGRGRAAKAAQAAQATQATKPGSKPGTRPGPGAATAGTRPGGATNAGTRPAQGTRPADDEAAGPAPGVPVGHLVVVTGLRPPGLGGYSDNPTAQKVRDKLIEILTAKRQLHPDLTVLTGMGLGAEQLGAEAAAAAGVPYVAVLAFPGMEQVWPDASRQRFAKLLASASATTTLQQKQPDSKQAVGGALARRDAWLARHASDAIIVWDGDDAGVGRSVRSFQDHLGEDEVWVLEP
jgi:ribonuclease HI/uncharacterized phage-like protein YoqJ